MFAEVNDRSTNDDIDNLEIIIFLAIAVGICCIAVTCCCCIYRQKRRQQEYQFSETEKAVIELREEVKASKAKQADLARQMAEKDREYQARLQGGVAETSVDGRRQAW